MADTKIEWATKSWNPVRGCSIVSKGCKNCYAMRQAHRFSGPGGAYEGLTKLTNGGPVWTGDIKLVPEKLQEPLRWKKPERIFVNSMSDLFHKDVPDHFIGWVFGVMAGAPQHIFQVLTKRPERMRDYCRDIETLPNVWLGVSIENQDTADERIPLLLKTPAAVRWLSCEPLLSWIRFSRYWVKHIDWVIVGGESGPGARPMQGWWANDLRKQCQLEQIPFFMKQGSQANWANYHDFDSFPRSLQVRQYPNG